MQWKAEWIQPVEKMGEICPTFHKRFISGKQISKALMYVTTIGVYEAEMNGHRVGNYVMAPGWTAYRSRLQYQCYDIRSLLQKENHLKITLGKGWYRSRMPGWICDPAVAQLQATEPGILVQIEITYSDGTQDIVCSDETWIATESTVRFSEIYDGEIVDATAIWEKEYGVRKINGPYETLIPQQGPQITEQERICPARIFTSPAGERIIDFGQEITGYVELSLIAEKGAKVSLSFGEVLDKNGNFYNENYRTAQCKYEYTCKQGWQQYKPHFTFYGFRFARINDFPGGVAAAKIENFMAVVLHSELQRTGWIRCSNPELNRLFDNILWGQKGNFLDVPTDCPQRDERLGWTGDAQAFIRTACFNYDCEAFFAKWLEDMMVEQRLDGRIPHVIPDMLPGEGGSAAWGDAATICPWELYLAYGNRELLERHFPMMERWVNYITSTSQQQYLWCGATHFGDWLGLDAPEGSYKGSSREDLIATAFYAHSVELLIKAGKALGYEISHYENLYQNIVIAFQNAFPEYNTQTECVLALHFRLCRHPDQVAEKLVTLIRTAGTKLQTGFVGTPYILHALSDAGYIGTAYDLLLRREYPSWLYPIQLGATTMWEHWDGVNDNGDFWSADMNSFNHYAYGAVMDWVYSVAAGIQRMEQHPGYQKLTIAPQPDSRLEWLEAEYHSKTGKIFVSWKKENGMRRYDIQTPVESRICIGGQWYDVLPGKYVFFE